MQAGNRETWLLQVLQHPCPDILGPNTMASTIQTARDSSECFYWIVTCHLIFLLLHRTVFTMYAWTEHLITENLSAIVFWKKELINPSQHMLMLCPRRPWYSSLRVFLKDSPSLSVAWVLNPFCEFQFFLSFQVHWHFQALPCARALIDGNHLSSCPFSGVLGTGNVRAQTSILMCHCVSASFHCHEIALT